MRIKEDHLLILFLKKVYFGVNNKRNKREGFFRSKGRNRDS
jgi:hypothetical protein